MTIFFLTAFLSMQAPTSRGDYCPKTITLDEVLLDADDEEETARLAEWVECGADE